MTNAVLSNDQINQAINSLPPSWQHYAVAAVVLLMLLGRAYTAVNATTGVLPIIKSVFMGSVHSTTPPAASPAPPPAPKQC